MKKSIVVLLFVFVCNLAFASKGEQSSVIKIEINNGWKFKQTDKDKWLPAVVPGCVHTDLLNNNVIPDPFYRTNEKDLQWIDKVDWEYETVFNVDSTTFNKQNIELIFKGLDTYADVYLNDIEILNADNMFREWKADVKKIIKLGENNLKIVLNSPVKVDLPKLKKLGYALPASNDQSKIGGLVFI